MATGGSDSSHSSPSTSNAEDAPSDKREWRVHRLNVKLTQDGYHYKFEDVKKAYECECIICKLVTRDTVQIPDCGHLSCQSCWGDWVNLVTANNEPVRCPICQNPVDPSQVVVDYNLRRNIRNMVVYCDYEAGGCTVKTELKDIENHMEECNYKPMKCSLLCGDWVIKQLLNHHETEMCCRRVLQCTKCDDQYLARDEKVHDDVCENKPLVCEHCDEPGILRKQLQHHFDICPECPTFCSYALIGCTSQIKRRDLQTHHDTQTPKHLRLMNSAMQILLEKVGLSGMLCYDAINPQERHELSANLRRKISGSGDNSLDWSELPGFVYNFANKQKINSGLNICERLDDVCRAHEKLKTKYSDLSENVAAHNIQLPAVNRQLQSILNSAELVLPYIPLERKDMEI